MRNRSKKNWAVCRRCIYEICHPGISAAETGCRLYFVSVHDTVDPVSAGTDRIRRAAAVFGRFLWGIFFFSLGSICLQRILLGKGYPEGASYGIRLFLYLGTAGIWGAVCLYLSGTTGQEAGYAACGLILLAGLCVCCGFELFNRYRAHMYNRLLEQYKKRRHV